METAMGTGNNAKNSKVEKSQTCGRIKRSDSVQWGKGQGDPGQHGLLVSTLFDVEEEAINISDRQMSPKNDIF